MNNQENWHQSFFVGIVNRFWQKVMPEVYTLQEIEFLKSITGLQKCHKILDIPSGFGRHSAALCKEGYSVTAVGISKENLDFLEQETRNFNIRQELTQADMLTYLLEPSIYDVAFYYGNSFNYYSAEKKRVSSFRTFSIV